VTSKDDIGQSKPPGAAAPQGSGARPAPGPEGFGVESLRPGDQLNGVYEIDALLARGGMGEVYRGHSILTGDQVAIKVIRADLAEDEVAIALFRNEASKLHRLHHEAIIRYFVFSVDPKLNRTYLAMEFVEGEPLSKMLRRGPLPVEAVRRLARRVALGLSAAHKREIIHRDVSSGNIIIQHGDVDEAKIIDFGIARSTKAATTLIDVGFAGKFNYVSPEQLGLFGGDVSARSDIYSLGLVLLEALRGAPADMGGTHLEVVEKRKSVPDLAGVDASLRPAIERMLQPDPDRRQQSMQAVADDFATPVGTPARMRGSRAAVLGAAAGLIALAGGAWLWLLAPPKKLAPPPPAVLEAAAGTSATPAAPRPPAAAEPQAPAGPRRPQGQNLPPALLSAREAAQDFIDHYDGGPCFAIVSTVVTDRSAKIEALGVTRGDFDELAASLRKAVGAEADIETVLVQPPQCAALDFYNSLRAGAKRAPDVEVATPFVHGGQFLTGSISAPADRAIAALLIGDDGLARNVTAAVGPAAAPGRPRTFSIAATPPKAAGEPQLLLVVSSAEPLPALNLEKPARAAEALPAAAAEARRARDQPGVALRYFYYTE
jgi:serine/threonine-protein kinase